MAWITPENVMTALGIDPAAPGDVEYLTEVTVDAEDWCRAERLAAGYADDPDPDAAAPSPRVKRGTVNYAMIRYRDRGSHGGAPAFDGFGSFVPTGPTMASVNALLGIPRMTVG